MFILFYLIGCGLITVGLLAWIATRNGTDYHHESDEENHEVPERTDPY